jgi:hypothetical protein
MKYLKTIGISALVIVLMCAIALCCGCTSSSDTSGGDQTLPPTTTAVPTTTALPTTEVTEAPTPEPTEEETAPITVTVHNVQRTDLIGVIYPLEGNDFVIVDFTVANAGEEAFFYHGGLVKLVNEDGYAHDILADVTFCPGMEQNNPFYPGDIESGKSTRGKVVFGIGQDETIVQFNLLDESGAIIAYDEITE